MWNHHPKLLSLCHHYPTITVYKKPKTANQKNLSQWEEVMRKFCTHSPENKSVAPGMFISSTSLDKKYSHNSAVDLLWIIECKPTLYLPTSITFFRFCSKHTSLKKFIFYLFATKVPKHRYQEICWIQISFNKRKTPMLCVATSFDEMLVTEVTTLWTLRWTSSIREFLDLGSFIIFLLVRNLTNDRVMTGQLRYQRAMGD